MISKHERSRSFTWGAGTGFALQGLGLLLAWAAQVALARLLPRAEFGLYTTAAALATTLAVPATLGLPVAMVRFLPEYRARRDWRGYAGVLRGGWALTLAAGLFLMSLTALTLALMPAPRLTDGQGTLLLSTVLIPLLALSSLGLETLRGMGRIAQAVWPPMLLQPVLMLVGLAALAAAHIPLDGQDSIALLAVSTLIALGVQFSLIVRLSRADVPDEATSNVPRYEIRRWLHVSLPLLLTAVFQILLAQMDVLAVSALLRPRDVAVYGVAAKLSRFIGLTQFAVYLALGPSLVEAHTHGEREKVQQAVTAATRWTFWPACTATVLMLLGGRFLLGLYGPGFGGAYLPLCILGFGFLVNAASGPAMVALNMTGLQYVVTRVSGCTVLGGGGLIVLLTWRYGIAGAAAASALAMVALNVWLGILAQRHLKLQVFALPLRSAKSERSGRQIEEKEKRGVG